MRARPYLVVSGITGHPNPVAAHTLLAQQLAVFLVDGADAVDRTIRVAKQRTREYAAPTG